MVQLATHSPPLVFGVGLGQAAGKGAGGEEEVVWPFTEAQPAPDSCNSDSPHLLPSCPPACCLQSVLLSRALVCFCLCSLPLRPHLARASRGSEWGRGGSFLTGEEPESQTGTELTSGSTSH